MVTRSWALPVVGGVAALALAAAAAGWAIAAQDDESGGPVLVQSAAEQPVDVISVSGEGRVNVTPDLATVNLGISLIRPSVAEARNEAATLASAVINSVKAAGVAERDVRATDLSIYPEYNYRNDGTSEIRGYRVTNIVEVKVRDLDKIAQVIDGAAAAGGNETQVQGISFSVENNTGALEQARAHAFENAKAKAEQLAGLAGVTLGTPSSISEVQNVAPPPVFYDRAAAAESAADVATPVQVGTSMVSVNLTVSFKIQ